MSCKSCESTEEFKFVNDSSSSDRFHTLVEIFGSNLNNQNRIYWLVDASGKIEEVSEAGSTFLLGIAKEDLEGMDISSTVFLEDRKNLMREIASPKEGNVFHFLIRRLGKEGKHVQVEMMGTFVQLKQGPKKWLFCDTLVTTPSTFLNLITEMSSEEKIQQDLSSKTWGIPALLKREDYVVNALIDNFSLWEDLTHRGLLGWIDKKKSFFLFQYLKKNLLKQSEKFENLGFRIEKRMEYAENKVVGVPELEIDRLLDNLFDHILLIIHREKDASHELIIKSCEKPVSDQKLILYIEVLVNISHSGDLVSTSQGNYRLLAITKIVDLFEGKIFFNENERDRIVFNIELPFLIAKEEKLSLQHPDKIEPVHKKIIFVDDSQKQRDLMGVWFQKSQYIYDFGIKGEDVLNKVKIGTTYDVYLLEHNMRSINGLETARKLRAMGVQEPIILISSRKTLVDKKSLREAGVSQLWKKPVNIRKLLDHIGLLS